LVLKHFTNSDLGKFNGHVFSFAYVRIINQKEPYKLHIGKIKFIEIK